MTEGFTNHGTDRGVEPQRSSSRRRRETSDHNLRGRTLRDFLLFFRLLSIRTRDISLFWDSTRLLKFGYSRFSCKPRSLGPKFKVNLGRLLVGYYADCFYESSQFARRRLVILSVFIIVPPREDKMSNAFMSTLCLDLPL